MFLLNLFSQRQLNDLSLDLASVRLYRVLTNPHYYRTIYPTVNPSYESFIRGLNIFAHSYFYRYNFENATCIQVTNTDSIHRRYLIRHKGFFRLDLFGRITYPQFTREKEKVNVAVKDINTLVLMDYDYGNSHRVYKSVLLDYQGNIIIGGKSYPARAKQLLHANFLSMAFLDEDDRCCCITPSDVMQQLPLTPPLKQLHIYCTYATMLTYRLSYCLTVDGNLYHHRKHTFESMNQLNLWDKPLRREVRKVVWFRRQHFCYINFANELMYWCYKNRPTKENRKGDILLMKHVQDAVRGVGGLYILKRGTVYRGQLLRSQIIVGEYQSQPIIDGLPFSTKHLKVDVLDDHHDIIQVW